MKVPFDISFPTGTAIPADADPWAVPATRVPAGLVRLRQPPEVARVLQRILMAMPRVGTGEREEQAAN